LRLVTVTPASTQASSGSAEKRPAAQNTPTAAPTTTAVRAPACRAGSRLSLVALRLQLCMKQRRVCWRCRPQAQRHGFTAGMAGRALTRMPAAAGICRSAQPNGRAGSAMTRPTSAPAVTPSTTLVARLASGPARLARRICSCALRITCARAMRAVDA